MAVADPGRPGAPRESTGSGARALRRLLLALVALGCVGLSAELALLEHIESLLQLVPFGVLLLALAGTVWMWLAPRAAAVHAFRANMALLILAGVAGLWLHFDGNRAFELEMEPEAGGLALVWLALRGATPALAPGALVQLGLIGLIATYRHPAVANRTPTGEEGT